MSNLREAPPVPRSPTSLQDPPSSSSPLPPPKSPSFPSSSPSPSPSSKPPYNLPPPPRFPSIKDVSTAFQPPDPTTLESDPSDQDPHPLDVSWQRPQDTAPSSTSAPSNLDHSDELASSTTGGATPSSATAGAVTDYAQDAQAKPGFFAKLVAIVKKFIVRKPKPQQKAAALPPRPHDGATAKPSIVTKFKHFVCKLPDPTMIFLLEATLILVLFIAKPLWLRTWLARLVVPVVLVPTVAMTVLWRRTRVVFVRERDESMSVMKPIPNAGKIVAKGESLRMREERLVRREEELRKGLLRLEMLRREIETRLPSQLSIANLIEREGLQDEER